MKLYFSKFQMSFSKNVCHKKRFLSDFKKTNYSKKLKMKYIKPSQFYSTALLYRQSASR
jgi:hypothetical protein